MTFVHVPVMPHKVIDILFPTVSNPLVVDATLGEGGHSLLFLERWPDAMVLGIDADPGMGQLAAKRLAGYGERFRVIRGWNDEVLANWQGKAPDIVFLDLGISSRHYKESGLGFSFSADEPLDMRLNGEGKSAADLVNSLGEEDLANLIFTFGEERYSRRIARRIAKRRTESKIATALQLANIVQSALPSKARYGRLHPATRTFQALRIAVNDELKRLERLLEIVPSLLAPNGKFGVISFHSLEDRMVKTAFRRLDNRYGGEFNCITRKALVADLEECRTNPPSRSAKFRILQGPS